MSLAVPRRQPRPRTTWPRRSRASPRRTRLRVTSTRECETVIVACELHLDVYVERCGGSTRPSYDRSAQVAYRERSRSGRLRHLHKKQTAARASTPACRLPEPFPEGRYEMVNEVAAAPSPPSSSSPFCFFADKGIPQHARQGSLIGFPVLGVRVVLTDGNAHAWTRRHGLPGAARAASAAPTRRPSEDPRAVMRAESRARASSRGGVPYPAPPRGTSSARPRRGVLPHRGRGGRWPRCSGTRPSCARRPRQGRFTMEFARYVPVRAR